MDAEAFRKHGHEVVDWMADYMKTVGDLRVFPDVRPGEIKKKLPSKPPAKGEPFKKIFEDFTSVILPGMTHWNHPRFFAYFQANNSPPSVLAEMLTAAMGAQCMSWVTSPAAAELEEVMMEWLKQMTGLPEGFTGVIQDTASTSTLAALICARERATDWAVSRKGAAAEGADRLTVYASREAHSSVEKGAVLAGFGRDRLRKIPTDETFAMDPETLEKAIKKDIANGLVPAACVATVGTTSSTAIDPLGPIGEICEKHSVWLHVDAALAGSAAVLQEMRWILDGIEYADSYVFNPHKWLFTNFDCSAYYVKDVRALLRTCSADPEYLRTPKDSEVNNYRDWGIPLGRRFRALKLWFVIRSYGVSGLRAMIRSHLDMAAQFRSRVKREPDWEVLAPTPLNLVCFRWNPAGKDLKEEQLDRRNQAILAAVNADGRCGLTHTRLNGRYTLRMAIGQTFTSEEDVRSGWAILEAEAARQAKTL